MAGLDSDRRVRYRDIVFIDQHDRCIAPFNPDDNGDECSISGCADGVRERGSLPLGAMDRNAEPSLTCAVGVDVDVAANPETVGQILADGCLDATY